jgi:hypothetical protein
VSFAPLSQSSRLVRQAAEVWLWNERFPVRVNDSERPVAAARSGLRLRPPRTHDPVEALQVDAERLGEFDLRLSRVPLRAPSDRGEHRFGDASPTDFCVNLDLERRIVGFDDEAF